jgi:antitoxin FitA
MAAITIRNVPEELRDELVARAARAGLPLERYLLWGLAMMVDDPCTDIHAVQEDWLAEVRSNVEAGGVRYPAEEILADLRAIRGER